MHKTFPDISVFLNKKKKKVSVWLGKGERTPKTSLVLLLGFLVSFMNKRIKPWWKIIARKKGHVSFVQYFHSGVLLFDSVPVLSEGLRDSIASLKKLQVKMASYCTCLFNTFIEVFGKKKITCWGSETIACRSLPYKVPVNFIAEKKNV